MTVEERLEKLEEKQDLINEKLDAILALQISIDVWDFIFEGMWGENARKTQLVRDVIDEMKMVGRLPK